MIGQMVFLRMNEKIGRVRRHDSNRIYDEDFVLPEIGSRFEKW